MVFLEVVPIVSLQSVPGSDPDEAEGIPDDTGGYNFRPETLECLEVENGEQLLLCEQGMTA